MIQVRDCPQGDRAYADYFARAADATVYHDPRWLDAVADAMGMSCFRLLAERDGRAVGMLSMGHARSLLFGNYLTSVPFGNFGGILADDDEARQALLDEAVRIAQALGARWIEFRHIDAQPLPLAEHTRKVRQIVPFDPDPNVLWERFDKQMRKHVRKAEKSGLNCAFSGREGLDDFYAVFARNMRDLGTPVYPRRFFDVLWHHMGDSLKVLTVRLPDGLPIASLVLLIHRRGIESPWASSLREHNSLCPNNLMFWTAFKWGCENGYGHYDFGTSDAGGGVYTFKKQWGAEETPLHRQYWLAAGQEMPHLNPSNPRYAAKIRMWQKLPVWLTKLIGPPLARKLP